MSDNKYPIFYRYEASINYMNKVNLVLIKYKVIKETPCGYWIIDERLMHRYPTFRKWIAKKHHGHRRLAHKTVDEALEYLYYRTKTRVEILESELKHAKHILETVRQKAIEANLIEQSNDELTPNEIIKEIIQ